MPGDGDEHAENQSRARLDHQSDQHALWRGTGLQHVEREQRRNENGENGQDTGGEQEMA